jgi:hypothetical protein
MSIVFNHPLEEAFIIKDIPYPPGYVLYKENNRAGKVFSWCGCGPPFVMEPKEKSDSCFLNQLLSSIEIKKCNAIFKKFEYILLDKTQEELKNMEDEYIKKCKCFMKHFNNTEKTKISLHNFVQKLNIGEDYEYLLMFYLEHQGYIEHGIAIRCAWVDNIEEEFSEVVKDKVQNICDL